MRRNRGLTLIELMIVLVLSTVLIAAIYRIFLTQQKTYSVQEQVVDMQQSARWATSRLVGEIQMAGFGPVSSILPITIGGVTYSNVINRNTPVAGALTILGALGGSATFTAIPASNQIVVSKVTDSLGNSLFDTGSKRYISIGGVECHTISAVDTGAKTITLTKKLCFTHSVNTTLVFGIRAITYQVVNENGVLTLERDDHTGAGLQRVADNIESLAFDYLDANGNPTAVAGNIRMIRATVTAKTNMTDPQMKSGDGYRRRQIASNIYVRNLGDSP